MIGEQQLEDLLDEQVAYYRARAAEYDLEMWEAELEPELVAEVKELERALAEFRPSGEVLELGCGTGTWTVRLAQWADQVTALDASPEMIAHAGAKVEAGRVDFLVADVFSWQPPRRFDVVFFSFLLSHVPPQRFSAFWDLVRGCLKPDGRVFFIDAAPGEIVHEQYLDAAEVPLVRRQLRDGREYLVVKVFHKPAELEAALGERGWRVRVELTARHFYWAIATLGPSASGTAR